MRSVREYLRGDLNTDLFDVAMLAGALSGRVVDGAEALVPFCPMLYQGWGLLRVNEVRLRREIAEASNLLRPALWTSFDPKGMSIVIKAFNEQKLG